MNGTEECVFTGLPQGGKISLHPHRTRRIGRHTYDIGSWCLDDFEERNIRLKLRLPHLRLRFLGIHPRVGSQSLNIRWGRVGDLGFDRDQALGGRGVVQAVVAVVVV